MDITTTLEKESRRLVGRFHNGTRHDNGTFSKNAETLYSLQLYYLIQMYFCVHMQLKKGHKTTDISGFVSKMAEVTKRREALVGEKANMYVLNGKKHSIMKRVDQLKNLKRLTEEDVREWSELIKELEEK